MRFKSMLKASALALAFAVPVTLAGMAEAKTFRFANDGDLGSMDPYYRNETFSLTVLNNVYEGLFRRKPDLTIEASLAESWSQPNPTTWRFNLRKGVKFQDGTPFTADDVVFSINRAATPPSNMVGYFASFQEVKKVDDYTVDYITKFPDPLIPDNLAYIFIMSKAWAEKHGAQKATDLTKPTEENYATRNANGTGPFTLKSREPNSRTTFARNADWWDKSAKTNVTEVNFSVVSNAATRTAALLSGEVDMVYTVPPQDVERISRNPGTKILQTAETRVVYLGFDQSRDELLESNIKGKNPFKDARVREAFYRAIDIEAIKSRVMRGQATPTALMVAPGVRGYSKTLDVRPKHDVALSKKLLADAGYPNGFEVGLDCPNDRYVNDEAICQAVTAMLARAGVKVNLNAQTRTKYFAKILGPGYTTSFFMLGWAPATVDSHNAFLNLIQTRSAEKKTGTFNVGGYSNPKFDELADKIAQETDDAKRSAMIAEATRIYVDDFAYIPLHAQALIWAVRDNIEIAQYADNEMPWRHIVVK
ncbi:MAG: ABC transporter substrate-binding protein [Alphaproteobacteria bacterium]|nr:ABC transporter substrate-binding protein [Alphaproteobacteria bacterium]